MTDKNATRIVHEPFFGNSAIHMQVPQSSTIAHDLKSECTSPTITQGNQTIYQTIGITHINSITWGEQSYHDLAMI